MNDFLPSAGFDLTGRFGGFVRTEAGKRRLVLRVGEQDCLLKVPRLLRRGIIGRFRAGDLIRVVGTEEPEASTGLPRRTASQVLAATPTGSEAGLPVAVCPFIRVCANKNCWRKGGSELWAALNEGIDASGLAGRITLRQVDCLDRCKQAPNVDVGGHAYTRCSPGDAPGIIARAAGVPATATRPAC